MSYEDSIIKRLSQVGIIGNIALTAFKLYAGIKGNSGAMVSDAIHSLSDSFSTFIALIGVMFSHRKEDKAHPYGHERMECVAALALGAILLATGLGIGLSGMKKILVGTQGQLAVPDSLALSAAIVSIIVKESMYWYTRHYAGILNSPAFMADAWHHRSDALSSAGSMIGICGAMAGYPVLDSAASVVICLFILKTSFTILKDSLDKMIDTSCNEEYEKAVSAFILAHPEVLSLDVLRTRMFGNRIYIDAEIALDASLTLLDAHTIAERVHDSVEQSFPNIKHIMIHINPADKDTLP